MATSQDFDNINEAGADDMAKQWRFMARAVKGLKDVFTGTTNYLRSGVQGLQINNDLLTGYTKDTLFITPQSGLTDDLIGLVPNSGLPSGTKITLRPADSTYSITIKHQSSSTAYKIQLQGGLDYVLDGSNQFITLLFHSNTWYEINRHGYSDEKLIGTAEEIVTQNSWAESNTPRCYKDLSGNVIFSGTVIKTNPGTNETMFTLPTGFRPGGTSNNWVVPVSGSTWVYDVVRIDTSGNVIFRRIQTYGAIAVTVQLNGIIFRAYA